MNALLVRLLTALGYAIGVGVAAYQAAAQPISIEGWIGIGVAALIAFWGKFSSSQTVIAPNRTGEKF